MRSWEVIKLCCVNVSPKTLLKILRFKRQALLSLDLEFLSFLNEAGFDISNHNKQSTTTVSFPYPKYHPQPLRAGKSYCPSSLSFDIYYPPHI